MNPKLLILRLLLDHTVWSEYRQFIKTEDDKYLDALYSALDDLHESLHRVITPDEFKAAVGLVIANERDKDKEVYEQYLTTLFNACIVTGKQIGRASCRERV